MNIRHLNSALGLTFNNYIELGLQEIMKYGKCILCGAPPVQAGICTTDGSDSARKKLGAPTDPHKHRFVFFGVCDHCMCDPALLPKVQAKIMGGIQQNGTNFTDAPLVDGQIFDL